MKITVIHGVMHKGSTWNCVQLVLKRLAAVTETAVTEFYLPRDMPDFCVGCYNCFLRGEETCPHSGNVSTIARALENADLIILDSPSYVCDVSGQMKTLLDHLGYQWLPHRPNPAMFRKTGLTVATAAGAGAGDTCKTMRKSLNFWGVNRIFTFRANVGAMNWDEVKPEKKVRLESLATALANKLARACAKARRPRLFTRLLFRLMQGMQKGNDWNPTDRAHWERQGWLAGKKPW